MTQGGDGHDWHNFRDMGGIRIDADHRLRRGSLFRAGAVSPAGAASVERFAGTRIDTICDLRNDGERRRQPTPWAALGARDYWYRTHDEQTGDLRRMLDDPAADARDRRRYMMSLYASLPFRLADSYRAVFARLAAGNVPLVFHCTAGKDRTGALAALILAAIGADRAAIEHDYLAGNDLAPRRLAAMMQVAAADRDGRWAPVLRADTDYLSAMFAAIDDRAAGLDIYLRDMLGITSAMRATIRALLVESG